MFKSERFENIVGGALFFMNLNTGGLTILEKCQFYNCVGDSGASISLDQGGLIYAADNYFSNDLAFAKWPEKVEQILNKKD